MQRGRAIRTTIAAAALIFCLGAPVARADDRAACLSETASPDEVIAGCDHWLSASDLPAAERANGLYGRAMARRGKSEHDAAIKDFDAAIRLNPKFAKAFNY